MALETGSYITDLVITNPAGGDGKSQGDDHIRLIKKAVQQTFPNLNAAVTATPTEMNYLVGVTSNIQTQIDSIGTTVSDDNTNATRYLLFADGSGSQSLKADIGTGPLTYNPSTGAISTPGNASVNGVSVGRGPTNVATNTVVGAGAAASISTTGNLVVVGSSAAAAATAASSSVIIGDGAADAVTTIVSSVVIGNNACGQASGTIDRQISIGSNSLNNSNATSIQCVAVGHASLRSVTSGSNNFAIGADSGNDAVRTITTGSNEGVLGNNNTTAIYAKVAITVTSDVRDKTEIAPVELGLDFVKSVSPISYKFRASRKDNTPTSRRILGFSAQELLTLQGNASIVDASDSENLKLNTGDLIAVLFNAVKTLAAEVEELRAL